MLIQILLIDLNLLFLDNFFLAFKYWGAEDVDINEELSSIANRAAIGEEGANGNHPLIFLSSLAKVYLSIVFYFS